QQTSRSPRRSKADSTPPASPPLETQPATTLCNGPAYVGLGTATVVVDAASAYIEPRTLRVPVKTFSRGTPIVTTERQGEWFLIRFQDERWGPRVGCIHCSELAPDLRVAAGTDSSPSAPPSQSVPPQAGEPSASKRPAPTARGVDTFPPPPKGKAETFDGY